MYFKGERRRADREMAKSVKGYRELKSEVEMARNRMKEVEMLKEKVDKTIQTSFYKSPVGTRYDLYFIHKTPCIRDH